MIIRQIEQLRLLKNLSIKTKFQILYLLISKRIVVKAHQSKKELKYQVEIIL